MKKVLLALLTLVTVASAGTFIGVEGGTGKAYGKSDKSSDNRIKSVVGKIGYGNEKARVFAFVGIDDYDNHEGNAKFYGVEFDKKFEQFFAGAFMGFGKRNEAGYTGSVRDAGLKAGYMIDNIDVGIKFTDRNFRDSDFRDRIGQVFVCYNFNL